MHKFSIVENSKNKEIDNNVILKDNYAYFHFYEEELDDKNNVVSSNIVEDSPICGITLRNGKSMRFRWNEKNYNRDRLLWEIGCNLEQYSNEGEEALINSHFSSSIKNYEEGKDLSLLKKQFTPVELFHTKDVYKIDKNSDTKNKVGDGIITTNPSIVPTITVADCVPIFFFDKKNKVFGIVHSGWKGTGIIKNAITLSMKEYNTNIEDVYVLIGPHIGSECYIVNEERAKYFSDNFTPSCVTPLKKGEKVMGNWDSGSGQLYHLSLSKANIAVLEGMGVKSSHITLCTDCTSCNALYGSNRRETSESGEKDKFTVMASFISMR